MITYLKGSNIKEYSFYALLHACTKSTLNKHENK